MTVNHALWQNINHVDESISCDRDTVMGRWKTTFPIFSTPVLLALISPTLAEVIEVAQEVGTGHLGKATGVDKIPPEVFMSDLCVIRLRL